jgi:hypothetical protein
MKTNSAPVTVVVKCRECDQSFAFGCTRQQFLAWSSGTLIQNAMPHLSPAERELLISRTCGPCFDALFAFDEPSVDYPDDFDGGFDA